MSAAEEFSILIAPLTQAFTSPEQLNELLRDLGVLRSVSAPLAVPSVLADLAGAAVDTIEALQNTDDVAALAVALANLFEAVDGLRDVQAANLGAPFDTPSFWGVLARKLPEYLLTRWLESEHGEIFDALALVDVVGPDRFDFARLIEVAGDLDGTFGEVLGKDLGLLIEPLRRFFAKRGSTTRQAAGEWFDGRTARALEPVPGVHEGVVVSPAPAVSVSIQPNQTGLALSVSGLDSLGTPLDLGDGWALRGEGGPGLAGIVVGGDWTSALEESTLDTAELTVEGHPDVPWVLLGGDGATRIELAGASLGLSGQALRGTPDLSVSFGVDGLRLVIAAGDADSFLASILGSVEVGAGMTLNGQWSPIDGLIVEGAASLSIRIPTAVTLGPITVHGLTITLALAADSLSVEITAEISGRIGPVTAAVAGMGLRLLLTPASAPSDSDRVLLGPVGTALAFKPPNGAGLGIDAGVASGGGFLYFGHETGRYDGVFDLQVLEVGVSAIVIIDTRAPDVAGWSMFFALFLDIPSIQLGFGFTLTGVGGLAGINRTIDTAALEAAVRSGSLDSVLFPENPIEDAPFVIETLRSIFPPADGQYVFGPVVRIGWGTPSLIEAEVGVVITLPDPVIIAVLGSVSSILPRPDLDLVALHLDVAGVIDFSAGTLAVDASLHDSYVACFALSGDMALRADFGSAPSFLLSLGGFHPGFDSPCDFPTLDRLRLAISAAPVLDISFECYMAITSNTVQFGSNFELSADIAGFGVAGGAQFDALVFFNPFSFQISVGFYISVTAVGVDLMGVWIDASVSGPNPWRVIGDARFKVLGIRESIHIDEQIGGARPETALPSEDPRDEMLTALANPDCWAAVAGLSPGVLLATADPGDSTLAARPDGTVVVSQKVAPLKTRLDKVGDAPIGDYHTFEVIAADGSLESTGQAHDWFAPGHYFLLANNERLSAPSFEWLVSGVEFGGGSPIAGAARPTTLSFEEILRDPELDEDRVDMGFVSVTLAADLADLRHRNGFQVAADPTAVTLDRTSYSVTDRMTGAVRADANTWSAARQSEPGGRTANTIVPTWELP